MHIFIVEDDREIRELESYALTNSGFEVTAFADGEAFFDTLEKRVPDLVLLDIMLAGMDGLEILRRIRSDRRFVQLPIIMVTAKSSELDTVRGLDLGADDYITKPFGVMELVSRIKARLRRVERKKESTSLSCGRIVMDNEKHSVTSGGEKSDLTYKEYELLKLLMENTGKVFTREKIMDTVWGYDYEGNTRTVDMHIKTLRKKLGACGEYISTVRGIGYTMEAPNDGE